MNFYIVLGVLLELCLLGLMVENLSRKDWTCAFLLGFMILALPFLLLGEIK